HTQMDTPTHPSDCNNSFAHTHKAMQILTHNTNVRRQIDNTICDATHTHTHCMHAHALTHTQMDTCTNTEIISCKSANTEMYVYRYRYTDAHINRSVYN